jgi:hypothetical protein
MTNIPEDEPSDPLEGAVGVPTKPDIATHIDAARDFLAQDSPADNMPHDNLLPGDVHGAEPIQPEPLLFQSILEPEPPPPARIPHLGHFFLLLLLLVFGSPSSSRVTFTSTESPHSRAPRPRSTTPWAAKDSATCSP